MDHCVIGSLKTEERQRKIRAMTGAPHSKKKGLAKGRKGLESQYLRRHHYTVGTKMGNRNTERKSSKRSEMGNALCSSIG